MIQKLQSTTPRQNPTFGFSFPPATRAAFERMNSETNLLNSVPQKHINISDVFKYIGNKFSHQKKHSGGQCLSIELPKR